MVRRFARPYARAIMDAAGDAQAADGVRADLARFEASRQEAADLREVFANPGIDFDVKSAIAAKISQRLGLAPLSVKVLDVLIRNHRINQLDAIIAALTAYVNDATNTVVAEVRSAHPLSPDESDALRKTLEKKFAKRVDVRVTPDPTLLGGFIARVGSEIYDASVVGKIDKFRESLN